MPSLAERRKLATVLADRQRAQALAKQMLQASTCQARRQPSVTQWCLMKAAMHGAGVVCY